MTKSGRVERPNVLFMLADDMGWGDVSYHGSAIRTPNIDRLVQNGIESALCVPDVYADAYVLDDGKASGAVWAARNDAVESAGVARWV
jgi:hypothetical protein